MDAFVWVDGWQQQCCGTPFRVGSEVRWTVARSDGSWVGRLLGPEWGPRVAFVEDHHDGDTDGVLTGVVSAIDVVTGRRDGWVAQLHRAEFDPRA